MSDNPLRELVQIPAPGSRRVKYAGDTLIVSLQLPSNRKGQAFLRTNLGKFHERRREVLDFYESGRNPLGRDWSDIPMRKVSGTRYEVALPLNEVGRFEFKTFFQCSDAEGTTYWPHGENVIVKIEPAATISGNGIYNAFVRQFGRNASYCANRPDLAEAEDLLNRENYTVLPPSGTFRDLKKHLDFIIYKLGFNIIQLLPIHPVPTTYGRMGRYGSPFAPLDFFAVDSSLAQFDRWSTPVDQFAELVDEIHARNAMIFLDLPADHTGWASVMQSTHPEWFRRNPDGSFESPGAWGTVWEDLVKLDFSHNELWMSLAEVFLHWCRLGVDGFRCDAGYMIPASAWSYIIAKVREEYPDTVFFLEGLGGGYDATENLLDHAGMNWAYSELFQNYSRDEIIGYENHATGFSAAFGSLVNFAETHDNDRLAKISHRWARMRTALAALFAPAGCFGIANGVEWYATEKIDVHSDASLNWGASENMVDFIAKLNRLLTNHPAFCGSATLRVPIGAGGGAVGLLRIPENPRYTVLAVVNPDEHNATEFQWNFQEFSPKKQVLDLLSGEMLPVWTSQCSMKIRLEPAQAVCLALDVPELRPAGTPNFCQWQQLRSSVMRFLCASRGYGDLGDVNINELAQTLYGNPVDFVREICGNDAYLPIIEWYPQRDQYKVTTLPSNHMLLVYSDKPFRTALWVNGACKQRLQSCPRADGRYFALFSPFDTTCEVSADLVMNAFDDNSSHRIVSRVLLLPNAEGGKNLPLVDYHIEGHALSGRRCALATTNLGGYSLVRGSWGTVFSAYDALLALNLNDEMPEDRRIVMPFCQIVVRHRGFTQRLTYDCQTDFAVMPSGAMRWYFTVPTGMGQNVYLAVVSTLDKSAGKLTLAVVRRTSVDDGNALLKSEPVKLLIYPYLENRSNHGVTKASQGAECEFPANISILPNSFIFKLNEEHQLNVSVNNGEFVSESKWQYSVEYPFEASRGLESAGDAYCPGFFTCQLKGGDECLMVAAPQLCKESGIRAVKPAWNSSDTEGAHRKLRLDEALKESVNAYVVNRSGRKTVMAGYPWFLDWGRDTLICLRGLLAAGKFEECAEIIRLFASYEENGTIPNMICGSDISNRDTSDAPLLLILAVREYIKRGNDKSILQADCNGRTLLEVMKSIVDNYCAGTPNGIRMCKESALIYSPSHFTWMDTNYPACTPREGYPVEIQAMWIASLNFLAEFGKMPELNTLAKCASESLARYYVSTKFVGLSDCLHCKGFKPAANAVADDHCRPNQLFAITLNVISDKSLCRHILQACQGLVIPGALRTLCDQPVHYALPLQKDGRNLNDPLRPYWGHYEGDEDTRRKPSYHNGTAWPWLLPSYCEALVVTYGDEGKDAALSLMSPYHHGMVHGCLGQLPEIMDGNAPHVQRGCVAQAWSVTEAYRVMAFLLN